MNRAHKTACGLHCIRVKHLSVTLADQKIIEDINLHVHCGSLLAIIGKNGAGKSTLVKAILGEIPYDGTIEFRDMKDKTLQSPTIGYVPQYLNIDTNTPTSVYDLIAGFDCNIPVFLWKSKKEADRIRKQLAIFGAEDLLDKQVSKLSGGELQRVLLALATIKEPKLLVLDEPVSGIDQAGIQLFYQQIDYLKNNFDMAILLISHDLNYVANCADEVVLLDKTILKAGDVSQVYHSAEFLSVFGQGHQEVK